MQEEDESYIRVVDWQFEHTAGWADVAVALLILLVILYFLA